VTLDRTHSASLLLLLLPLAMSLFLSGCSSKPPEQFFLDDIQKMVLIDRNLGFLEEITEVEIIKRIRYEEQHEIQVRVTGWAVHPDITIGATLPAFPRQRDSWAIWKYFCRKVDKKWVVDEKYKVEEGFE
jgi:hypothetical protein